MRNLEILHGMVVAAFSKCDSSVGGLNVAEGDEIIGVAKNGFGFLQNPYSFFGFAFLE